MSIHSRKLDKIQQMMLGKAIEQRNGKTYDIGGYDESKEISAVVDSLSHLGLTVQKMKQPLKMTVKPPFAAIPQTATVQMGCLFLWTTCHSHGHFCRAYWFGHRKCEKATVRSPFLFICNPFSVGCGSLFFIGLKSPK